MLRQFLETVQAGSSFGIISTVIFISYFSLMVIHALKMSKKEENEFSRIPLEETID
jgi:hypothetical protein